MDPISPVGLIAIGAGLAVGIAAGGSAIGQGMAVSSAVGMYAEDEKRFTNALIFSAIPETQAIYGFVIAFMLISQMANFM